MDREKVMGVLAGKRFNKVKQLQGDRGKIMYKRGALLKYLKMLNKFLVSTQICQTTCL